MNFNSLCIITAACLAALALFNVAAGGTAAVQANGRENYNNGYDNGVKDGTARAIESIFDQEVATRE